MKHTIFWMAFGLFCILPIGIAFSQADMKVLSEEAFPDDQRPPAVFVHDEHNAKAKLYDCSLCHHVYKDGQKVQGAMSVGQGCSDCHSVQAGPDNSMDLLSAYHTQCLSCHQEESKGPLACGECHVR